MTRRWASIAGVLWFVAVHAGASARGPEVLTLDPSVRAAAMGGCGAALGDDSAAGFSNPAAIQRLDRPDVFFSHTDWGEEQSFETVALARPFWWGGRRTWSASIALLHSTPLDLVSEDAPVGRASAQEGWIGLGFAQPLGPGAAGLRLKGLRQSLSSRSGDTVALDAGFRERWEGRRVEVGATLLNAGPAIDWGGRSTPLPLALAVGAVWSPRRLPRCRLAVQGDFPAGAAVVGRAGLEWRSEERRTFRTSLRAGGSTGEGAFTGGIDPSLGGGVEHGAWTVNYAFLPRASGASVHRLDFGVRLGRPLAAEARREERIAGVRDAMAAGRWIDARANVNALLAESPREGALRALAREVEQGFNDSLDPAALRERAREAEKAGRLDESLASYRLLRALQPDDVAAGAASLELERRIRGEQESMARRKLAESRRRDAARWARWAREDMEKSRWRAAHAKWRRVLAWNPVDEDARRGLARCRAVLWDEAEARRRSGQDDDAESLYAEILAGGEDPAARERMAAIETARREKRRNLAQERWEAGMAAYAERRWDDAERLFREVLTADPDDKRARRALERVTEEQRRRGRTERER
jgi:tetratricopeptide (TPR) repeat protein